MPMGDTLSIDDLVTKKTGRKRGRPSTYSVEVMEVICERLAYGESLRQICCDETMPGRRTVFQWLEKHPGFADFYTAAREAQIDYILGENVEIRRSITSDTIFNQRKQHRIKRSDD